MRLVDKVLRIDGFTVITGVVADVVPPNPVHVSVYVTMPVLVGATVSCPLVEPFAMLPAIIVIPVK
jgi:hypothetical protein